MRHGSETNFNPARKERNKTKQCGASRKISKNNIISHTSQTHQTTHNNHQNNKMPYSFI